MPKEEPKEEPKENNSDVTKTLGIALDYIFSNGKTVKNDVADNVFLENLKGNSPV